MGAWSGVLVALSFLFSFCFFIHHVFPLYLPPSLPSLHFHVFVFLLFGFLFIMIFFFMFTSL